jgi:uncharacterized lipoprotein
MFKLSNTLALAAVAGVFTACASSEPVCNYDKEPYMAATSVPPLRAPEGLTTPDRSATLIIPPPPPGAPAKPSGKGRCLDRPPSYFQTAPAQPGESEAKPKS